MKKLYIIDAVNYLFRSYYAIGPMTNEEGQSTGALFGFIRSLNKLLKDYSPDHLVCVFDGPDNKKSRQAVYAEYKMHRKGAPEDLFAQFEWADQYCKLAGIPVLCESGVEADDTMASVATWAVKNNFEVFICSSDKDLMQLVSSHIFLLQTFKDNLLVDAKKVEELFGVRPNQMLDLLALMGDASDNIPGLEGFGPKTAASLLQEFGTLDAILAHPEKVKGEKKQKILREDRKTALLSRDLATLDTTIAIPHAESFYVKQPIDRDLLTSFFQKMKFNSLLKEMGGESKQEIRVADDRHLAQPESLLLLQEVYHLVDSESQLTELLAHLHKYKEIGIDTETTSQHPLLANLVGIGFAVNPGEAWYVPFNGQLEEKKIKHALRTFCAHFQGSFLGHNIKYDYHILKNLGIELKHISFDTILASYLIDPQSRAHNLDILALEKFNKVKIPIAGVIGTGKAQTTMLEAPIEKVCQHCCEDIDYTCRLKKLFEQLLQQKKLISVFQDIEMPLIPILAEMERTGIYLDIHQLAILSHKLTHSLAQVKKTIFDAVGEEFNLNSPKQLSDVLYHKLKLPPPKRKKSEFSTGAEVLEELSQEHPVVREILDYRLLEKLRSTYVDALPATIHPHTHRIHCTFNQSITATGRLSCQDPNLQNIPVRTPEGLAIRACFKPQKPGWSFVGADYSQIELRLLAHFSQDPELVKAFKTGQDVHTYTASLIFSIPPEEVDPEMRAQAKTVNFGVLYGQSPYGLSQQLGISMQEASDFIKTYFQRYPKVLQYIEECKAKVRETGIAETLNGRQRAIPEMNNKNPMIRSAAERLAVNTPLQGTAADLIKGAMIEIDKAIHKRKLEGKMILQIHDELIFEVPDNEVPIFMQLAKEKMEQVMKLHVPIEVHIAVGKNWAEC